MGDYLIVCETCEAEVYIQPSTATVPPSYCPYCGGAEIHLVDDLDFDEDDQEDRAKPTFVVLDGGKKKPPASGPGVSPDRGSEQEGNDH